MTVVLLIMTAILFIIIIVLKIILIKTLMKREQKLEKFTKGINSRLDRHSDLIKDLKK